MDVKYFNIAKDISKSSTHMTHKLGCVIVNKGRVVGKGYNKAKTHPKSTHLFKHVHAEFSAMLNTPLDALEGSTIYVYRQTKAGLLAKAKPCPSCYRAIIEAGIERVCYTDEGGYRETKAR